MNELTTGRRKEVILEGCTASLNNGQIITSTGNSSLDQILGGGMPIGSILLIEEDKYNNYAKVIAKYYLAEGLQRKHGLLLHSFDDNPADFIKTIPSPCEDTGAQVGKDKSDEMRIAFRYNQLPKIDSELSPYKSLYDLSKPVSEEELNPRNIHLFGGAEGGFSESMRNIKIALKEPVYSKSGQDSESSKNLLRICIKSLGSPLWYLDQNFARTLKLFLLQLKAIVRNSYSVCLLTIPMHLLDAIDPNLCNGVRNFVDLSVEIESFAASEKETNPVFKDYNGLVNVKKLSAVNTLACYCPDSIDLGFKLRRRRFVIEKLHLPPELGEDEESKTLKSIPKMGCASVGGGGGGSNKLDF